MTTWTRINSTEAHEKALELARGEYQRSILLGSENLSGSTLKGKARKYGLHYSVSRATLLRRLRDNGISVSEEIGPHGARILVIG